MTCSAVKAEFLMQDNDDYVMDESDHDWRLRDDAAKEILFRMTQCRSVSDFQKFDFEKQKEIAGKLYPEGLSLGQIARLTGMSKATVYRAVQRTKDERCDGDEPVILRESDVETCDDYDTGIIW